MSPEARAVPITPLLGYRSELIAGYGTLLSQRRHADENREEADADAHATPPAYWTAGGGNELAPPGVSKRSRLITGNSGWARK